MYQLSVNILSNYNVLFNSLLAILCDKLKIIIIQKPLNKGHLFIKDKYYFSNGVRLRGVIYLQHYPTRDPARREQVPINSRGSSHCLPTTDHLLK